MWYNERMSVITLSSGTAYATKPNIVQPALSAQAANLATRAATRINDDPSNLVSGALSIAIPQDGGASDATPPTQLA